MYCMVPGLWLLCPSEASAPVVAMMSNFQLPPAQLYGRVAEEVGARGQTLHVFSAISRPPLFSSLLFSSLLK